MAQLAVAAAVAVVVARSHMGSLLAANTGMGTRRFHTIQPYLEAGGLVTGSTGHHTASSRQTASVRRAGGARHTVFGPGGRGGRDEADAQGQRELAESAGPGEVGDIHSRSLGTPRTSRPSGPVCSAGQLSNAGRDIAGLAYIPELGANTAARVES